MSQWGSRSAQRLKTLDNPQTYTGSKMLRRKTDWHQTLSKKTEIGKKNIGYIRAMKTKSHKWRLIGPTWKNEKSPPGIKVLPPNYSQHYSPQDDVFHQTLNLRFITTVTASLQCRY